MAGVVAGLRLRQTNARLFAAARMKGCLGQLSLIHMKSTEVDFERGFCPGESQAMGLNFNGVH